MLSVMFRQILRGNMDLEVEESRLPKVGAILEHYKGKRYEVLAVGHHTETLEPMVVYKVGAG